MLPNGRRDRAVHGQIVVLFALCLVVVLLAIGLVIDGGFAWTQRRASQNAADLAATAGARIVGLNLQSGGAVGTDANVKAAIDAVIAANGGRAIAYGVANNGPQYVDKTGTPLTGATSWVGNGTIPATASGVTINSDRSWRPFFLGVAGISSWTAGATATARAGFIAGAGGGDLLPIAMKWDPSNWSLCAEGTPAASCPTTQISPLSNLNKPENIAPGQFGWMSWDGTGNTPYLCSIIGPPADSPVYTVPLNGYITIPGNTGVSNSNCVRDGIDAWVAMGATILVPIVSPGTGNYPGTSILYPPSVTGNGSNATYNIIGFAGFQLTGCSNPCIKNLEGVFREAFFLGPTIGTSPSPGSALAVQLVR